MLIIKQNNSDQCGFTLVELMVALAIGGVVLAVVLTAFRSQQKVYGVQEEVVVMQQNLRAAMNMITRDLRMASYAPVNGGGGITTATVNQIVFTHEIDNLGTQQTVQYDLYDAYGDGDTDIGRQVNGVKRALAENIDALEFVYLDVNGNALTTPVTLANLNKIKTIQVSILARADRPDFDFLNTLDYFPASCPQPLPPAPPDDTCVVGTAWDFDGNVDNRNAFDDGFRRRLLTTTIQLRN